MGSNPAAFGPRNRENCRNEQFIVPTVFDPPSVTSEQGLVAGIPYADDGNLSRGVRIETSGEYRQTRTQKPEIHVRIETPGTVRAPLSVDGNALTSQLFSGELTIDKAVASVGKAVTRRVKAGPVNVAIPRVSVKRLFNEGTSDADYLGVREAFTIWPDTSYSVTSTPPAQAGGWIWVDAIHMLEWNGALWAVGLASNGNDGMVRVLRHDPRLDSAWTEYAQTTANDFLSLLTGAAYIEVPTTVAPVVVGNQLYALVSVTRKTTPSDSTTFKGVFYVLRLRGTQWTLVGSGLNSERSSIDGGSSATAHPSGDGVLYAFGSRRVAGATIRREVNLSSSSDMQTWPTDATSTALQLPTLSDFSTVVRGLTANAVKSRSYRNRVAFVNRGNTGQKGFLVDTLGRIFYSANSGQSWTEQASPAAAANNTPKRTFALRSVSCTVSGASSETVTAYAVGDGGLILKTTNAGETWSVIHYSASHPVTDIWPTATTTKTLPNKNLYGVWVDATDASSVWVCGEGGLLAYSSNGGAVWAIVRNLNSSGAYLDMIVDSASNALLVGDASVHDVDSIVAGERKTRLALVKGADSATPAFSHYAAAGQLDTGDDDALVSVCYASQTSLIANSSCCFAVSADGRVKRWVGNGTTGTVTEIAALGPGQFYAVDSPNDKDILVVAGERTDGLGNVWTSTDASSAVSTSPVRPSFIPQGLPGNAVPCSAWYFDETTAAIGCLDRIVYASAEQTQNRTYPAIRALEDGTIVFATANISTGRVEIYRADTPPAGQLPEFRIVYNGLDFTAQETAPSALDTSVPRPTIAVDHLGHVIVATGTTGVVSFDNGRSWVRRNDSRLPIALGVVGTTSTYTSAQHYKTRSACGYGGARLFSTCLSADGTTFGTFVARDWTTGASVFLPVFPGRPFWLGLDTVKGSIVGKPEPGDAWTIPARSLFPVSNIMLDSPRLSWRSSLGSFYFATPGQVLTWTAPAGKLWDVSAFALFGCNFRDAILSTSVYGFPTEYNTKAVSGEVATGFAAALASTTYFGLRDSDAAWNPHCFAPGSGRTYRITINDIEGTMRVYRILDNTHNVLLLDTADTPPIPADAECAYTIWSDVHVWDGTEASNADGTFDLNTTEYRLCKTVRIEIPTQPTAEGYFTIGTARIGVLVDSATPLSETAEARLYSPDWAHTLVPNTAEELSLEGVSNLEHFGQVQRWQLVLEAAPYWYRERLISALSRKRRLRDAFAFVFDPDVPQETKLVRLVGELSQKSTGVDEANLELQLVEVV